MNGDHISLEIALLRTMHFKYILLLLVVIYCDVINSARILCSFPIPSSSHQAVFQAIWRELALRGHEVVVLTPKPLDDPTIPNLKEIYVSGGEVLSSSSVNITLEEMASTSFSKYRPQVVQVIHKTHEHHINFPEVQALIKNETEHFDLLIFEWRFPTSVAFSKRFNCPVVAIATVPATPYMNGVIGNPFNPSITSEAALTFFENLSFKERLISFLGTIRTLWYYHSVINPLEDTTVKKYFGEDYPYVEDIEKNISLLISASNRILSKPLPKVPTYIEVSGLHLRPKKPLPKDLQEFLDDAKEGVVYFSLGNNVQSTNMGVERRNVIMQTFSELPYKVLWKWENDTLQNKPDNVLTMKWIPQQDVLGHPNVKVFITQGGLQSLEEAIANAVPVLVVPIYRDQFYNAKAAESAGIGINLKYLDITKDNFKNSIIEVITNPKYKEKALWARNIFYDQPMSSLDTAVWWIEYVIRHKGAKHLRSPYADISWVHYLLLDVISFIAICLAISLHIIVKLVKLIIGWFRKTTPSTKKNQ